MIPPLSACTCEASTAPIQVEQAGGAQLGQQQACRAGHTPASVQSRIRRQQVTPEQPTTWAGSWFQLMPVLSTNTIPASATRSSTGSRPGNRRRRGGRAGSNGATSSHNESGTRSSTTARSVTQQAVCLQQTRRSHSETSS